MNHTPSAHVNNIKMMEYNLLQHCTPFQNPCADSKLPTPCADYKLQLLLAVANSMEDNDCLSESLQSMEEKDCLSESLQSEKIPLRKDEKLVKCAARSLKFKHDLTNSGLIISRQRTPHGARLRCIHPRCAERGTKFKYCRVCKIPVALQNFGTRHKHV
mmetsp:Transcript_28230/g.56578  ORF Transcript_28230/g.56578 Transcript_28230/m.56578 type:complete len:159 (-) Transcript_28230:9-485(-)